MFDYLKNNIVTMILLCSIAQLSFAYNKATFEYVKNNKKLPSGNGDLSYANLRGLDLSNAQLSGADLTHTDFGGANLSNANLSRTKCVSTNFTSANLSSADLSYTNLDHVTLARANLSNASCYMAKLNWVDMNGAIFNNAELSGIFIEWSDLRNVNFSNANLSNSTIGNVLKKIGGDKYGVCSQEELSTVNFNGADISGVYFCRAVPRSCLSGALNIDKARF